ncbi:hypothetical protein [Chelativorans sp.]|uniref:hypothetical protein n=1 Tax=Chelativorans sp. TaxID=2203393 RepID=UPI002811E1E7|nr:hypothetical protein [Chelativorans sp.]
MDLTAGTLQTGATQEIAVAAVAVVAVRTAMLGSHYRISIRQEELVAKEVRDRGTGATVVVEAPAVMEP